MRPQLGHDIVTIFDFLFCSGDSDHFFLW
jgi:hypothetical protein